CFFAAVLLPVHCEVRALTRKCYSPITESGDFRSIVLAVLSSVQSKVGKLRVLAVDDHPGVREGNNAGVKPPGGITVVGDASDGQAAIERFRALQPDVTLLDWNLPMVSGEEVLEKLIGECPNARFIVITAISDDDCIRRAFCLGARAYLHKDMLRRE